MFIDKSINKSKLDKKPNDHGKDNLQGDYRARS